MTDNTEEVRDILQSWLDMFTQYSAEIFGSRRQSALDELRTQLQRNEPAVTCYLIQINGNGRTTTGNFGIRTTIEHGSLLPTAVAGGNNEIGFNFTDYKAAVIGLLNRAIGSIDARLWPPQQHQPILTIKDEVLIGRCHDLLQAPDNFDRVVREATIILEDRLRNRISHDRLTYLIPDSAKQTGENLVNILLAPGNPVLSISTDQRERAAFHRIMLGVFAYLRNPFHHHVDDTTEWSWSWSIVGFIDHLLNELQNCEEIQ